MNMFNYNSSFTFLVANFYVTSGNFHKTFNPFFFLSLNIRLLSLSLSVEVKYKREELEIICIN